MATLKLTAIGTSTGAVIPKEMLARHKVAKGDALYAIQGELTDTKVLLHFGGATALVNNAAMFQRTPFEETTSQGREAAFEAQSFNEIKRNQEYMMERRMQRGSTMIFRAIGQLKRQTMSFGQ